MTWPAAWHRVLKKMPRSKKFSNNFDGKNLLGVFHIPLPDDSKVHFSFAVYEVSELECIMNSLCYCVARRFANQGAYYLALEKKKGALERKMNHSLPFRTL